MIKISMESIAFAASLQIGGRPTTEDDPSVLGLTSSRFRRRRLNIILTMARHNIV